MCVFVLQPFIAKRGLPHDELAILPKLIPQDEESLRASAALIDWLQIQHSRQLTLGVTKKSSLNMIRRLSSI